MLLDANKLQSLYLRYLYSENVEDSDCPESKYLNSIIDFDRLIVERKARQRNLRTVLWGYLKFINNIIDRDELLCLIEKYSNSNCFWMYRAGTILEDFCLFVYEAALEKNDANRDVYKLEGIVSAIGQRDIVTDIWDIQYDGEKYIFEGAVLIEGKSISACDLDKKYKYIITREQNGIRIKRFHGEYNE